MQTNLSFELDLWLIIPPRYRKWITCQNTLQTFHKQHPPKTTTWNLMVRQ